MGFCFSSCRRRRPAIHHNQERQPLLTPPALIPPRSPLDVLADVLAALSAGKLPSQQQCNHALRTLLTLHAPIIAESIKVAGLRDLDERANNVAEDARCVVHGFLRLGTEKNSDDLLQRLIHHARQISDTPVHVEPAPALEAHPRDGGSLTDAIPTQPELRADARALVSSLHTLARLLFTSASFRLLLSSTLLTVREIVADTAADVRHAAERLVDAAGNVEDAVRPGGVNAIPQHADAADDSCEAPKAAHQPFVKEAIMDRIEYIIAQAQENPAYHTSLATLLYLLQKYTERVRIAADAIAQPDLTSGSTCPTAPRPTRITPDPTLTLALADLRTLLERCAGGRQLDSLLTALAHLIHAASHAPRARAVFADAAHWADTALRHRAYAASRAGRRDADALYDRVRALLSDDADADADDSRRVAASLRAVVAEADAFVAALTQDKATRTLVAALDALSVSLNAFVLDAGREGARRVSAPWKWKSEAARATLAWVLPRLVRVLRALPLPMPRVELRTPRLDAAVDALILGLGASELSPDCVRVQSWSEVRFDAGCSAGPVEGEDENGAQGGRVTSAARIRVHVDGLRVGVRDVGYYARYKGLVGYTDEGLLSVDVGGGGEGDAARGSGLALDIEVETEHTSASGSGTPPDAQHGTADAPLFAIVAVRADVRGGMRIALDASRHWVWNKVVVQPLLGVVARRAVGHVLAQQVRAALEAAEGWARDVRRRARGKASDGREVAFEDYWAAILEGAGRPGAEDEDEEGDEDGSADVRVETHTTATAKGIVRTTVTHTEDGDEEGAAPQETVLAVGFGAQILPGKGEPQARETPAAVARKALGEVDEAVGETVGTVEDIGQETVRRAAEARREVEGAGERMHRRERAEARKRGWRSRAFDF